MNFTLLGQDMSYLKDQKKPTEEVQKGVRLAYVNGGSTIDFKMIQELSSIKNEIVGISIQNQNLNEVPNEIIQFKNLKTIDLSHNNIRKIDPKQIAKFKKLKKLYINSNPISDEVITDLRKALPSVQILFYPNQFQ